MTHDPDIRSALKTRLDRIDPDAELPEGTLLKGRRRRRGRIAMVALGAAASTLVVFVGVQVLGSNGSPATSPAASSPSPAEPSPSPSATPPEEEVVVPEVTEPGDSDEPPPVTVSAADRSFDLTAWSYCYGNMCRDGAPGRDLPDVGSPDEVAVDFPLPNWSFVAWLTPAGNECGRWQKAPVEETADGGFVLRPVGHADTYDVTLSGEGKGGSLSVSFRWTTPVDGPLPEPQARLAVVTDDGKKMTSYGVELELKNLAETPKNATATISIEAANGDSITFEAERAKAPRCWPEGTVYWNGPAEKGPEAAALGEPPFDYSVEVTLDGVRYVGRATWPDDEIRGNEPSATLTFTPELPRVR